MNTISTMTPFQPYTPLPDTLAAKVIAWFLQNPHEALTANDIAVKFDALATSVNGCLKSALHHHHICKHSNTKDSVTTYTIGQALRGQPANSDGDSNNELSPQDNRAAVLCQYIGQGMELTHTPNHLHIAIGEQSIRLSTQQINALTQIAPALMGLGTAQKHRAH